MIFILTQNVVLTMWRK